VLAVNRLWAPGSELAIEERWYPATALDDLLGMEPGKINDTRLYRCLDGMIRHKTKLEGHLRQRYGERKYGRARRVWVFDRGVVSEENLAVLRRRNGQYLVGTPRSKLKQFQQALLAGDWEWVRDDIENHSRPLGHCSRS